MRCALSCSPPTTKPKGKRNADRRVVQRFRARRGTARAWRSALACRRSAAARTRKARQPVGRNSRPGFLGRGRSARSDTLHPTGGERPGAATRVLSAPACPSPVAAPHGPVVMPVSMMPGAAPARLARPRGSTALAPHGRFASGMRPLSERASTSQHVTPTGTIVKVLSYFQGRYFQGLFREGGWFIY
jgi:hypothetical protein